MKNNALQSKCRRYVTVLQWKKFFRQLHNGNCNWKFRYVTVTVTGKIIFFRYATVTVTEK